MGQTYADTAAGLTAALINPAAAAAFTCDSGFSLKFMPASGGGKSWACVAPNGGIIPANYVPAVTAHQQAAQTSSVISNPLVLYGVPLAILVVAPGGWKLLALPAFTALFLVGLSSGIEAGGGL